MVNRINAIIGPECRMRVAYGTKKTSSFFLNKDKVSEDLRSNIVYKYICSQCSGHTYIGETTRHLITRTTEQTKGVPVPSEVSLHQHVPQRGDFKEVLQTKHTTIGEALVYNSVPTHLRLNSNRPPFGLKLFPYADVVDPTIS